MAPFGPESTSVEVVNHFIHQVRGRTFLINGVSQEGIGAEIATSLASASPRRLILVSNSHKQELEVLIEQLTAINACIPITVVTAVSASFSNVREAAHGILSDRSITQVDVVFNIPAGMPGAYSKTEDGHEHLLQTNYLSHFLLTSIIMPKLLAATPPGPRVINVSSSANKISGIRWHDPDFAESCSYEPWTAYGQTKTAGVLFTVALNARLLGSPGARLRSYAVHPGGVKTSLQKHLSETELQRAFEGTKQRFGEEMAKEFFRWKTLQAASSTPLRAALDPELLDRDGVWLEDCELLTRSIHLDSRATDPQDAEKLWKLSEDLIGARF